MGTRPRLDREVEKWTIGCPALGHIQVAVAQTLSMKMTTDRDGGTCFHRDIKGNSETKVELDDSASVILSFKLAI